MICLCPLQVDSIFVFVRKVAVLFHHNNIFVFICQLAPILRHIGYLRHQQVDL